MSLPSPTWVFSRITANSRGVRPTRSHMGLRLGEIPGANPIFAWRSKGIMCRPKGHHPK